MKPRAALAGIFLAVLLFQTASASEWITQADGQPLCLTREQLQEYVLAMMQGDRRWMAEMKYCGLIPKGMKVAIIEHFESDSDIGHVVKVRAFLPAGAGSAVGYTLSIGLVEKK